MTDQTPIRVRATHDLRSPTLPIKSDTLGVITGTTGTDPAFFSR